LRVGLLSQWYEPEPVSIPAVLARELSRRAHSVRVLTGFPNFPEGRIYAGYRMSWRRDGNVSEVPVRRVALFPSHGPSGVGRLLNYGSFAISASALGTGWLRDIEALWVYNSPPTVGLPAWIIKSRYRPRVVMHVMDLWPESLQASGFGDSLLKWPLVRRGLDKWLSMTYEVADAVACTSHAQIELLAQRGVPRSKLSYVPVWVDESIFYPTRRDDTLAADLGIRGKTVLLYAGAIGEPQGLDVLIEACMRLRDEPTFHCVVAGSGIVESRLRAHAEREALRNISFLGRWPIKDMTRLMSIGDIHLVSLRSDPLAQVAMPSKLPATLACGKPVIVAARGDAAGVVARAGAGWVCSPGNAEELETAIRAALAASPGALRAMAQRGRKAYESEFAVVTNVGRLERLLSGAKIEGKDAA
jgi:putative colanic acid biosynthesis glycosyltransferase WcaI